MEAGATSSYSSPAAVPINSFAQIVEDADGQQHLKRKADQANLDQVAPKPAPALSAPACPNEKTNGAASLSSLTRQGSCPEMPINLEDSSSEGEDETGVPADSLAVAAVRPASASITSAPIISITPIMGSLTPCVSIPTHGAAALAALPSVDGPQAAFKAISYTKKLPNLSPSIKPEGLSTNGLSTPSAAGNAQLLGGDADFGRGSAAAAAAICVPPVGFPSPMTAGTACGGAVQLGATVGLYCEDKYAKSEDGNVKATAAAGSPGAKRKTGRPFGSKSRSNAEDPPYVASSSQKEGGYPEFAASIATRPRRQRRQQARWDPMNPGEQWLRKLPKPTPPLPPNPVDASIPEAPTFYPTMDEFRDPLSYIESIRTRSEVYGIARIVPPRGWNPPRVKLNTHARKDKKLPTKKQALHNLMNSDEVYDDGRDFTPSDYRKMALKFAKYWASRDPPEEKQRDAPNSKPKAPNVDRPPGASKAEVLEMKRERIRLNHLEREYWNVVDGGVEEAEVEYANDLDISKFWSGFPKPAENYMDGSSFDRTKQCDFDDPEYYKTCGWNLNNVPFWPGSVLRFFRTHVNGLTVPWLYMGMQFATFAWHNEDNYLYSLNYHHEGAPKQWYGVPGKHSKGFEACLAKFLGETLDTVSEHLYRITKMLSPVYLQRDKVPVCRLLQHPGQFIVTFPKAYHGGFSYGFNCAEAVNFAVPNWISYSRESTEAYRTASRVAALSHDKMVATLTMYLPDHDINGCELVVRELKRIYREEIDHRMSLELSGVQDPARQGVELPRFRLGLIERDTEEYDERRVCKTCKHTLFMTGVACPCSDVDVYCLRCVRCVGDSCDCPVDGKYLLSWWKEGDLSRFVRTAEMYLGKLKEGTVDEAVVKNFKANIDPFDYPESS